MQDSGKETMNSFFNRVCNVKESKHFPTNWNDGIALSQVIEYLHPGLFPDIKSLSSENKKDNCQRAIRFAQEYLGIPSIISAEDMANPVVDKRSMMTYLSYFIKSCIQKIHKWAQSLLPQRKIKNMSSDWCSGIHLTALINVIRPGILPNWAALDEECGIDNVTKAMDVAKHSLSIEPSLTPADMTSSKIDEMSVAAYLAPFMLVEITKPPDQVDLGQVTYTGLPGVEGFVLVTGEEINFSVDTSKAGKGKLVAQLVASDGSVEVLTTKAANGMYTIKKQFMVAGSQRLILLFNEKELISMPVEIRKTPEPNKCVADYSLLRDTFWNVRTNIQFKIDCTHAGGGELEVKVTNPYGSEISATKSVDTTGGKRIYVLKIIPESEGVYSIAATWAGKSIRGSPFNFTVADPKKVKVLNLPSVDRYAPLTGETLLFEVDTSKAFRGLLTGQVIDSSGAVSQLEIQELTKENYMVKHRLTRAGTFDIKLYYNEVEVLHFSFTVSMTPVPSECVAHFNIEKNQSVSVGQTVAFRVDCSTAGAGELTAMASCGIQKNDIPVRTSLNITGGRRMYLVTLLPKVAGPYFVTILWANKPIPGSPFAFQASDESLVKFLNIPDPETFNPVVGDTITFEVDTSKAGKGIVVAQALYEGHQPQEFSANEKGNGLLVMKYVFPRAGNVDVPVLFNGAQLTSMAYTVKPAPDASKCITRILQENEEYLINVSQFIKLSVDCTDAGSGEITVKCTNPQGNSLDAIIAKDTNACRTIYRVHVQPDVVGTYRIVVLWAGTPVRNSPFTVEVADPNQVKFLKLPRAEEFHPLTGDSIAFDIDATKAGKGLFAGKIIYENTTEDMKIISKGTGMFGVKHVLAYATQATIIIHFNGVQILTMVYTIQLAPHVDKCKVMIPEQNEYLTNVGQMIEFMVDCTEAGTGELQVKATGPKREIKISTVMESIGIHKVKFLPDQAGTYSVNILWVGMPVPGSPFKFEVADPNAVKFLNLPKVENFHPITGDHINFDIDVSRAGKGDLKVQCMSNGLTEDLQLTSRGRGMFSLQHIFERPCQIQLLVFYNGVQLIAMESTVKLAPDASKCRAIIQDQQEYLVNVGELVELAVNTSEAGNGVLTAKVVGPQRKEVDIDITDYEDSYTIQFVPKEAGTYFMTVLWAGKGIPLSPFSFEIANPNLVKFLNLPKEQKFFPLIGENVTFDIDVNKAGRGKLHALVDTLDSESIDIELIEKRRGVYSLKHPVTSTGPLQFAIIFNGIKVLTFDCEAKLPPDSTQCQINLNDTLLLISQPIIFSVDCTKAGIGKFTVNPMRKDVQTKIIETNSVYTVQAETHLVGEYSFEIIWSGKVVGSHPVIYNVFDPTRVKVMNLPIAEKFCAMVGETLTFEADTSKAGKGRLTCQVITDDGKSLGIEPTQKGRGTYAFGYKFTQAGSLEVVLLYNNINVFTLPWTCQVVDINQFHLSIPTLFVEVGNEAKLEITSSTSEMAYLKITATRGKQPCAIQMSYEGTIAIGQFRMQEVGEHKIEARYGNKMIPGSPVLINGCNPSKCQFASQISSILHVGEAEILVIKSNEAGPGTLKCNVSNNDLLSYAIKTDVLSSQINLQPKEVGSCEITFTWADFPIPNLQIDASIVDASLVSVTWITLNHQKDIETNDNISFLIDGSNAGQGDMKFNAKGPMSSYIEVDVVDNGDGTIVASFIATQVGKHTIDVTWGGKPVKDMPLIVDVHVKKAIRAEDGALILGIVDRKEIVTIMANYKETELLAGGGLSGTMITADGYDNDIKPIVEIKKKQNGVYVLTYIAEIDYPSNTDEDQPNTDSLDDVKPAPDASKCQIILTDTLVLVDSTIEFDIDCTKAGCGKLTVTGKDPAKKNVPVEMSDDNNLFIVKFNAVLVGVYTFDVLWSGNAVPDSPVKLYIFDPTKVTYSKLPRSADFLALVGHSINFDINASKAGKGQIITQVVLSESYPKEIEVKEKDGLYNFKYDFVQAGTFELIILFNNCTVLNEPWKCPVVDMSQIVIAKTPEFVKIRDNVTIEITGVPTDSKHLTVSASNKRQLTDVSLAYTDSGASATFCAEFIGEYKLEMKYGGKQLNDSPLMIKSCNPDVCQMSGQIPNILHVKESKSVTIQTSKAGPGLLKCTAHFLTEGTPLEYDIKSDPKGTTLMLKALAVGTANIGLEWGNFPIHKVPFEVQVVDASLVTVKCVTLVEEKKIKTASKVVFEIDSRTAGRAPLQFNVMGPRYRYKTDVRDNEDGTFTASFNAAQVGSHKVEFLWGGKPILQSPLAIDVKKGIGFNGIRAEGNALKFGFVNKKETVNVTASDSRLLKDGDLSAEMSKVDGTDSILVEIKETGLGLYTLSYIARTLGEYELQINHEGKPISDSPFYVNIKQPPNASKCISEFLETNVLAGTTPQFTVNCKEAGFGTLAVKVKDPTKKNVQVKICEDEEIYIVSFEVTTVGEYIVEVFWSGTAIPDSPFSLDCFDPGKAIIKNPLQTKYSNLLSTEDLVSVTGEVISFDVDISNAGKGELKACIIQEGGSTQDIIVNSKGERIYTINYHMLKAGRFELCVIFNTAKLLMRTIKVREAPIAGKCRSILQQEVQSYAIGQPITFKVDCTDAGSGVMSAAAKDHSGKEVIVHISEHIETPRGSPVCQPVVDPSKCVIIKMPANLLFVGVEEVVKVSVEGAGSENLEAIASDPSVIKTRVEQPSENIISVILVPTAIGKCSITLKWAGVKISNMPIQVNVCDPSQITLHGVELETKRGKINKDIKLTVKTASAGKADLAVKVTGFGDTKIPFKVSDNDNNSYSLTFVPTKLGKLSIDITWGGVAIPNSPFCIKITTGLDSGDFYVSGKGIEQAVCGEIMECEIVGTEAHLLEKGILKIKLEGENLKYRLVKADEFTMSKEKDIQVSITDDGKYHYPIQYMIPNPGTYILTILLEDTNITNSPFNIRCILPPNPSESRKALGTTACFDVEYPVECSADIEVSADDSSAHGKDPQPGLIYSSSGEEKKIKSDSTHINSANFKVNPPKQIGKQNNYVRFCITGIKEDAKQFDIVAIHTEHKAVVTQKKSDSDTICHFIAKQLGKYNIMVKFGGKHISGSPFTVDVCNPDNCQLSKEFPKIFHIGEIETVDIDANKVGPGSLTFSLRSLTDHDAKQTLQYKMTETGSKSYKIMFKPLKVGSCQVAITWSGYDIHEGVFEVNVVDSQAVVVNSNQEKIIVDEEVIFNIDGRSAGKALPAFKVKGPKAEYTTTLKNNQNGTFTGVFTPWHTGVHSVEVLWGGRPVNCSPFKLTVRRAVLVDPTKIIIEGYNHGCAGIPGNLLISSSHRDLLEEGGLSANMIKQAGANLEGQEPKVNYLDEDHNIKNPVDFSVDVTNAGPGLLTTKVMDPNDSQVKVCSNVDHTPLNVIHYLTFNPKITGNYIVNIFWDDMRIPGTPFNVNVIDPSKCTIKGLPLKDYTAVLNKDFIYSVNTKNAGNGKVHSVISRLGQDDTILTAIKKGNHEYQFQYLPDKIGKFSILIYFSKKELNGSPFPCKTVDIIRSVGARVVLSVEAVLVCEPYEFRIQGSFPDPKGIKAIAHGPKDDIAVEVYPSVKSSYVARFIPLVAGCYKVFVEYPGQQISNSPFSVACIDPGKCKIIGNLPLILQVGKETEFVVETIDSGPGTISLLVNNEQDNHNCKTVIETQSGNMHKIILTPRIIGGISVHVLFAGYGIPRTPFRAQICDASKCKIIANFIQTGQGLAGKTITFTLDTIEAGTAKPTVKAQGPTSQYSVDVIEVAANTYKCGFIPWEVGKHLIHVIWGVDHIPGSPFQVAIGGVCTAAGLGLKEVVAGEPTKFNIHTKEPGLVDNGILVVDVTAIHYKVDVQIEDKCDGEYVVTYTSPEPGAYLVKITYNGKDIAGSPFKVDAISRPDASKCHTYGPALESKDNRYTDVAQEFYVDTAKAGRGKLNVLVRGPNDEQCTTHVKKEDGKIYNIKFNAEHEGLYVVTVSWSNNPVPGSPFRIKVQQAVNAKMVNAYGPGLQNGRVGECGEFTIETKNAGSGTPTVYVHGVTGSFKVEVFAKDPDKPHFLTARYNSTIAGKFDVFIRWGGTQIPGSPFTVLIADPSGIIPSATLSSFQYQASIETSYKQSQTEKKLRIESSKIEMGYGDDDELPTERAFGDEDEDDFQDQMTIQQVISPGLLLVT